MRRSASLEWEDVRTVRGTRTAAVATGSLILKEKEKLKSTVWHDKTV